TRDCEDPCSSKKLQGLIQTMQSLGIHGLWLPQTSQDPWAPCGKKPCRARWGHLFHYSPLHPSILPAEQGDSGSRQKNSLNSL
ncbi:mCG145236, partial [Mus musculus]